MFRYGKDVLSCTFGYEQLKEHESCTMILKSQYRKMPWMRNIKNPGHAWMFYMNKTKRGVATGAINGIIAAPLFIVSQTK